MTAENDSEGKAMSDEEAQPANSSDEIAPVARAFAEGIQGQIIEADKMGADDDDLCIVVPAGYMALVFQMPLLYIEEEDEQGNKRTRQVAVCTKKSANALLQTLMRESGWRL
jgi:hypothetical protein